MLTYCFWEMWRECMDSTDYLDKSIVILITIFMIPICIVLDSLLFPIEIVLYILVKHRDKQVDKEFEDLGGK